MPGQGGGSSTSKASASRPQGAPRAHGTSHSLRPRTSRVDLTDGGSQVSLGIVGTFPTGVSCLIRPALEPRAKGDAQITLSTSVRLRHRITARAGSPEQRHAGGGEKRCEAVVPSPSPSSSLAIGSHAAAACGRGPFATGLGTPASPCLGKSNTRKGSLAKRRDRAPCLGHPT